MEVTKEIGKIQRAWFGAGGYQDAMIGLTLQFGSDKTSWGVQKFYGAWGMERSEHCKWTEEDRLRQLGEAALILGSILTKAKKRDISELVGVPVEVTFENGTLKDWRVLEEVL